MQAVTLRGRYFSEVELVIINRLVDEYSSKGRTRISQEVCKTLDWKQPNGWLKERACREVLRKLEERGYLQLPASRKANVNTAKRTPDNTLAAFKNMPLITEYGQPRIELVKGTKLEKLWNALVKEHHYQSYSVIVGNNLKYLVYLNDVPVACLGWGSAAWAVSARDNWLTRELGWSREDIQANLPRIINNVRFLMLPWVNVHNFASTLLSQMEKVVIRDWQEYYNISPLLLETFVEKNRFKGTCYKAANWTYVGDTSGSSKRGQYRDHHDNIKYMYIRPIAKAIKRCQHPIDFSMTSSESRTELLLQKQPLPNRKPSPSRYPVPNLARRLSPLSPSV